MGEERSEVALKRPKSVNLGDHIDAICTNLSGPVPIFMGNLDASLALLIDGLDHPGSLGAARMFVLALGSLRAAFTLCQGGATPQVPALLRHAVECAQYGYLFHRDAKFARMWREREEDPQAKSKFRNSAPRRISELLSTDSKEIASGIRQITDSLISFGAHPNVFQVTSLIEHIFEDNSDVGYEMVQILTGQQHRDEAYDHVVSGYVAVATIYGLVWPERYAILSGAERLQQAHLQYQEYRARRRQA